MGTALTKIGGTPTDLGEGVIYFEATGEVLPPELAGRHRFLDVLWLPCHLNELRPAQIFVINRFREGRISSDQQFRHASISRQAVIGLISRTGSKSVLEIGCGKFPVAQDVVISRYRAVEIDPVAVSHCRDCGFEVVKAPDFEADDSRYDIVVSLYALHFAIDLALVQYINDHLAGDGCLIFNVIVDDMSSLLGKLALLTRSLSSVRVIKEDALARKEYFFVVARSAADPRAGELASVLRDLLKRSFRSVEPLLAIQP